MDKRIKSFLITAVSIFGTAFTTLIFTPQWSDFVNWLGVTSSTYASAHHIPTAIVLVVGVLVAEIWKQILNSYIIRQAGFRSVTAAREQNVDLY